jgi:hypothetical protein
MSAVTPAAQPGASQQAVVEAALVLLERMGLSPADLAAVPQARPAVPTFAEYVPVVSAAVTAGRAGRTARTGTASPGSGAAAGWMSRPRRRSAS